MVVEGFVSIVLGLFGTILSAIPSVDLPTVLGGGGPEVSGSLASYFAVFGNEMSKVWGLFPFAQVAAMLTIVISVFAVTRVVALIFFILHKVWN